MNNIWERRNGNYTFLQIVAFYGTLEICKFLEREYFLPFYNNVDFYIDGETPFLKAAGETDGFKKCKWLFERGADKRLKTKNGRNALHVAVDPDICSWLIEQGLKVNAKDEKGNTPLHIALKEYHSEEKGDLLLEKGSRN